MNISIENIIDKHLQKRIDRGTNKLPGKIESDMSDPNQDPTEEWQRWFPIISKVTDQEIQELELTIGYKLPESYKALLKHKHFYDLKISEVEFCSNISANWQDGLLLQIFDGYPREFLIDKGYIPFADFSDWGLMCFDTHHKVDETDYEIVLWDHERWDEYKFKFKNFTQMMFELDVADKNGA